MQQERKALLMEKKGKVGEKQMMKKRQEEAKADTDNDSLTSSKCVDDNSEVDMASLVQLDNNVCSICIGEKDDSLVDWVSCDFCGKWFHVGCVTDDSLRGKMQ